jgi:hypothetical protein
VAALGLATLLRRWRSTSTADRAIVGACSLLALALASPLIGAEWAERLSLMAYLPGSVVLGYLLSSVQRPALAKGLAAIACAACVVGLAASIRPLGEPSIPPGSVEELRAIGSKVKDPDRTLVIARHGLEWWAAWFLRTKVAQEFDLEPAVWGEYAEVFMLVQKKPESPGLPGGPNGAGGRAFPEVRLGDDARVMHDGRYFLLARAPSAPLFYPQARPVR